LFQHPAPVLFMLKIVSGSCTKLFEVEDLGGVSEVADIHGHSNIDKVI
jgi:hypothetical protein